MKTTIEITDSLLRQAKRVAEREGVTLRTLVERGLHHVVAETKNVTSFELRRVTFKGNGLQPEYQDASWEKIRDAAYEGRGS